MKKASIILMLCFPLFANSQSEGEIDIKRNSIYVEAFGQGLYNSFSFDRIYSLDKKIKTSFTAGITLIPSLELAVLALPISYNYLFGQNNHHLELGIGITPMYLRSGNIQASIGYYDENGESQSEEFIGHSTDFYSYFTPKIGYRFQKSDGGIFMRATFTPPVAGYNRIGSIKGGEIKSGFKGYNEVFSSAAFFGGKVFPWAGISVGWTMK